MTEDQAKAIFEKYNPAGDVRRCPHGRGKVQKSLNVYAVAAVNLYGIIRRDEFVDIFNAQNEEPTTAEEAYTLLLPMVVKSGRYGFYKNYIVHYMLWHDIDVVNSLERVQGGKPRYIPPREQFVKFEREDYEDHNHWLNLRRFMGDTFGYGKGAMEAFAAIKACLLHSLDAKEVSAILKRHGLVFRGEDLVGKFLDLVMLAERNSRLWETKGHTAEEIAQGRTERRQAEPVIHQPKHVGRNQPCPCGSGKKYKKCCART